MSHPCVNSLHRLERYIKLGVRKHWIFPEKKQISTVNMRFSNTGALKSVQATISTNKFRDTTRVALIASLLIYCFESLYGDLDLALRHLESALQLMQTQLARASRRYAHSKNSSPTPNLDDDLVAAFFRLDSGLLSRDDIFKA
jgi:hypothetical protein